MGHRQHDAQAWSHRPPLACRILLACRRSFLRPIVPLAADARGRACIVPRSSSSPEPFFSRSRQHLAQRVSIVTAARAALAIVVVGVEPDPKYMPISGTEPDVWLAETEGGGRGPAFRREANTVPRGYRQ